MKKIFTLIVFVLIVLVSNAQAVLNEIYPQPGNGYQEFFELYNPGASENLDNYTIITYYEESGGKSGFYILDMPNQTISANGYYIGASASPISIQGQAGLTPESNWNALPAGGILRKMEKNGSTYTSVSVPANLNDLFVKITGAGGVFHVFVYKNGILVNGVIGGLNATIIPAYLKAMPDLFVDMSGSSPDFTIKFSAIPDNGVEYISSSVGTNNGYYRSSDGKCGTWLKSDAPGQHTPDQTNGTLSSTTNQLNITMDISFIDNDPTKSLLTYNIKSGDAAAFPVVVDVYYDLGIIGELDINDSKLDTRTINNSSMGDQFVPLPTSGEPVILVAKCLSGCYDKIITLGNYAALLPVHLISFKGNLNKNNKVTLQWTVGNNEETDQFEVQRSINGNEFKTIGIVFATEKTGKEDYLFYETINSSERVIYRLKMIDKGHDADYSKTIVLQSNSLTSNNNLKIKGNPVKDKLSFNYTSLVNESIQLKIYDMNGRITLANKLLSNTGTNMINLPLNSAFFKPGIYVVELSNGQNRQTAKFIKQ